MRMVEAGEGIYLFLGKTPADLGRPFMRLQEYYESPSKLFRRRFFTAAKFEAWYRRYMGHGEFSYFRDFNGYNVPGNVFEAFFCLYADSLTSPELELLRMLGKPTGRYYVIGANEKSASTVDHELSHAFFYLYPAYRSAVLALTEDFDLAGVRRHLRASMYAPDVMDDEVAAYTMFDSAHLNRAGVKTAHLNPLRAALLHVFGEFKRRHVRLAGVA